MAKKKSWKVVDQKEMDKIHQLKDYGLTNSQIGKIIGRPSTTVSRVAKYKTLEEYREATRVERKQYAEAQQPQQPSIKQTLDDQNKGILVAQRLDHIESQLQELVDTYGTIAEQLSKKKLLW